MHRSIAVPLLSVPPPKEKVAAATSPAAASLKVSMASWSSVLKRP
jgi:hypothetical protein